LEALALLEPIDAAAAATLEPTTRGMLGVQRARAALYAGRAERVMADYLDAIESASAAFGSRAAALAPYAEPLAWALFEFGEHALAAEVAMRARTLDPEVTISADILLELVATQVAVPGRPDPAFAARLINECDRVEHAVLRSWLVGERDAPLPTDVPADCGAPEALRLEALGLAWNAPAGIPAERRIDTPLLARLRGAPDDARVRLLPAERARIEAWLAAMDAAVAADSG
jgi:hypothetical protein